LSNIRCVCILCELRGGSIGIACEGIRVVVQEEDNADPRRLLDFVWCVGRRFGRWILPAEVCVRYLLSFLEMIFEWDARRTLDGAGQDATFNVIKDDLSEPVESEVGGKEIRR
jgi:hypothetical protein